MNFILQKEINSSLFKRGFAIPLKSQSLLALNLSGGALNHGEKRNINLIFSGETYNVTLTSVNFDKNKYPIHPEIWQIVYSVSNPIIGKMAEIFSGSRKFLMSNLKLPDSKREYLVMYATDIKDTFYVESIFNREILSVAENPNEVFIENLLDVPNLTDNDAALIERYALTKIRKLNKSIGDYLKRLYNFRCQICGQSIGDNYGVHVAECHHINYFVKSLNNDADNLLILCPNHHRIIHAANPTFDSDNKIFRYDNGYCESLKLNEHL